MTLVPWHGHGGWDEEPLAWGKACWSLSRALGQVCRVPALGLPETGAQGLKGCLPLSDWGEAAAGQAGTRYTGRNRSQLLLSL